MTSSVLIGAGYAVLLIALAALAALYWTASREARLECHAAATSRDRAERYREQVLDLELDLARTTGERDAAREHELLALARAEGAAAELAELRKGPLVGRLVNVNTPEPDGQSIRGVCTLELEDGGVVLQPATYLDTVRTRGNELEVVERPMLAAVIPRYAWAQLLEPDGTPGERLEPPSASQEV